MPSVSNLAALDPRMSTRHPIDYPFIAEHHRLGDLKLRMVNISPEGFMAVGAMELGRGERVLMRLPVIGRIEAHVIWHSQLRVGFRFERLIRLGDFTRLLIEVEARRREPAND